MTKTFMPEGRQNIPSLVGELLPRGTFFTRVVNRGILGHYVANASLATGCPDPQQLHRAAGTSDRLDAELKRPASDTWVIAPSVGFERIGESQHAAYGPGLGANVVLPKRLLASAVPAGAQADYQSLLRQLRVAVVQPEAGSTDLELERLTGVLKVSVSDFLATRAISRARTSCRCSCAQSHAAVRPQPALDHAARHRHRCTREHSRCTSTRSAVRRLCAEIWKLIQSSPEYAGRTSLIRPSSSSGATRDETPGGNGFQHHRTGDARSRTTWMLAMGPDIRENVVIDRPIDSMDLVPTLGSYFGFSPQFAQGKPVGELF